MYHTPSLHPIVSEAPPVSGVRMRMQVEYVDAFDDDEDLFFMEGSEAEAFVWRLVFTVENAHVEAVEFKQGFLHAIESGGMPIEVEHFTPEDHDFPLLQHGEKHTFECYAVMHRPHGALMGSFHFEATDGRKLQVQLPSVFLDQPERAQVMH